jgi:electron transfer flavoprotein beta subunit
LNILVGIKQVPLETEVLLDPQTNTLIREGVPSEINPSDLNALESALLLKDTLGAGVTVVSMGPRQAEVAVKQCLAMGADEGVLLCDQLFAGSDTLATAKVISKFVKMKKRKYDLIICGHESIDGNTGQVGPELAELLNMDHISWVTKIEHVNLSDFKIRIVRKTGNFIQTLETCLPVLITILRDSNTPRPFKKCSKSVGIFRAQDIGCKEGDAGLGGSPTNVAKIFPPKPVRNFHPPIDSSLPARKKIELILDGGIVVKEKQVVIKGDKLDMRDLIEIIGPLINTGV